MFCDRCGTQAQEGQRFCGSCGKPLGMAVVPPASGPGSRVARHVHLLGVLWLAASALNLVGAAVLFILGNTLFGHLVRIQDTWPIQNFLQGMFIVLGFLVLIKALLGFAAGWGLLQHEPWARILTLVLGFLSLINIPLGTALGIYTIWVLLARQAEQEYSQLARAA